MCDFLCVLRLSDIEKTLLHCKHENCLYLVCDIRWVLSVLDFKKFLSQTEQGNFISTVCDTWCLFISPEMMSSILDRGSADTADQPLNAPYGKLSIGDQMMGYSGQRKMWNTTKQLQELYQRK